ncbi:hypothetical protein GPA27_13600 [Aromatoleum toluolicum]|uniref:Uncharacterized protein n=1 Tax=Aromatoleum toluolicum TaxID=90060 RepID=A0ABX1NGM7_9RHOO|nr:hypothetical protein [Aromatoleum toluolicum]NMF98421.1 hypothetical protein [Aromatoleum toluolicum]
MLLRHTKERPDLNDGQRHEPEHRQATALHLMLALKQVRQRGPFRTAKGLK